MSRPPTTNQVDNPESLLRNDLEDFSRDLLGLHARFQSMFPVLANSRDSSAPAGSTSAAGMTTAQGQNAIPEHLRNLATRGLTAIPPSPALTPSQAEADHNLIPDLGHEITEIEAKMTRKLTELRNWVNAQDREVFDSVGNNLANLRSHDLQALEAYKEQVEKELKKIREENMKRQQAEEKMRKEFLKRQKGEEKTKEELWGVIRKMQAEIEELKKGQVRQSVERSQLERGTQANLQHVAAFEGELMSSHLEGSTSRENEVPKNYTSSALVPFSPQVDNNTSSHNNQGFGQFANSALVVSGLDLTTRPANRGSQSLTSVPGADREPSDPNFKAPVPAHKRLPRINYNNFPVVSDVRSRLMEEFPALWVGDDDDEDDAPTNKRRAPFGKESHTASGRPLGRLSQGTAAPSSASRSRSPRKSLNANFRVRDEGSEPTSTSKSRSSRQRSSSSSSVDSIPNENEQNLSSQSIPSRFQPSRRTKSANELIDKHLSFIPNGWRTIIANTAKQLSSEDWDKSDAKVLKKLEEHCPSFKGLEEILPNVKMAVPALRDLVRDLKKYC